MSKITEKNMKKLNRHHKLIEFGLKHKLVYPYSDWLFDRLRPFNVAGFPASIMLLIQELNNGHCYDRAMLMQLAFADARVVHADINSLRYVADYENGETAEHAFVETKAFGRGKTWVVDTSMGLIYDKRFYYLIEQPTINRVIEKSMCMEHPDIKDILAGDFEQNKYVLTLTMPSIEKIVENSNWIATLVYREKILKELEIFKKAINYEDLVREVEEDVKLMRSNPAKLDEKFGIVRDKYGREISRNGIPNPYYVSHEELVAENEYIESIKGDEGKMREYLESLSRESSEQLALEDERTSKLAKARMEEILNNPKKNFYEWYGYPKKEEGGESSL